MAQYLKTEVYENGIVRVIIANPPVNALNSDMERELNEMTERLEHDKEARVLIVTGAGEKSFMAGADLDELAARDRITGREQTKFRQSIYDRLSGLPVPSIAAVNGYCLGAGLELILACDIRIASDNAKFAAAEINLGIIPGNGGTQRLPRMIGQGRAMHMVLTGDRIGADQALEWGLVTDVVPQAELGKAAYVIAEKLADKSPLAIQYAKDAVGHSLNMPLHDGLMMESYLHALACASDDKSEGVSAVKEKRKPAYSGK